MYWHILTIAFGGGFLGWIIGFIVYVREQHWRRRLWEHDHPNMKWEDWHNERKE